MRLGIVAGRLWNGRQHPALSGCKLLVVRFAGTNLSMTEEYAVCIDDVDAGAGDWVITVGGSSARMTGTTRKAACDQTVIGVVDRIDRDQQMSHSPHIAIPDSGAV